jgi:polar amino acid transport system substrate-binding protein
MRSSYHRSPGSAAARRARFTGIALALLIVGRALGVAPAGAAGETEVLAPSGHLRVGVYPGSPTSQVTDPSTQQIHGVTYDLGREFAARLNVPVEYLSFQRIADVVNAIKDGKVDFTVTNATAARANDVSFSRNLLSVELGYLVPANSPIVRAEQIDGPGIRIGVTKGGTSERVLSERFKNAKIISAESVAGAINALRNGELDVYASCSKCRSRCPARGCWTTIGARSIWRSRFRRDARPDASCSTALCATSSQADCWSRSRPMRG